MVMKVKKHYKYEHEFKFIIKPILFISAFGNVLRPASAKSWAYSKTEVFPHFMQDWLHGSGGRAFELVVSKTVNGFFSVLEARVRKQDEAVAKKIKAQEDRLKIEAAKKSGSG